MSCFQGMSDGRGAFLVCPGCDGPMAARALPPLVDVCHACGGVWFDWFDGEATALSRTLDVGRAEDGRLHPRAPRCPRDGGGLVAQPYLDSGPPVLRCPDCMGLFADRTTIRSLQDFQDRLPQHGDP